jgi:iron complex transport system permease protein
LIFFIAKGLNRKYETYFSVNKIILSGIAINALLSAVNALLLIVAGNDLTQIIYWMNGGLNGRGWEEFKNVIVFVIIGLTISLLILKNLKIINIGDEIASSLGINLKVTQILAVIACSLLASSAVAVAGIISFIGLIIPNIIRLILGSDLKFNFAGAVLLGPVFMIISDLIARTVISPSELPVGIVTAFIGAPVFVWLILKSKNI